MKRERLFALASAVAFLLIQGETSSRAAPPEGGQPPAKTSEDDFHDRSYDMDDEVDDNDDDDNKARDIDANAERILRRMSAYLGGVQQFTLRADSTTEVVTTDGEKLTFPASSRVSVHRPNMLRSDRLGAKTDASFFYDGDKITILGKRANLYAQTKAPDEMDDAIDFARDELGLDAPGADLLLSDAFDELTENMTSGKVIGRETIDGVPVQHLAFRGDDVDFQIWIEDGARPLPRRYVITTKTEKGEPEFRVDMHDWNLNARLPDSTFTFVAPPNAKRISFRRDVVKELREEAQRGVGK